MANTGPLATSYVDHGLAPDSVYSYAVFAFDEVPNYSAGATLTGVTDTDVPVATGDWLQARQGPEHRGWSPKETTIRPANVGTLEEEWNLTETGAPVIDGTTLFVSGTDDDGGSRLIAYDLATGSTLWERSTGSCAGPPALTGTRVVVNCWPSGSGEIRAYQRGGAHNLVWSTADTDPGQAFQDVLLIGSTVVARGSERVNAYRLTDGQRIWQKLLPAGSSGTAEFAASGDRVVVAYGNRLTAYSLTTGNQAWTRQVTASDAVISDGWVYTSGDGTVRRYALANGTPGWTYTSRIPSPSSSRPRTAPSTSGPPCSTSARRRRRTSGRCAPRTGRRSGRRTSRTTGSER